MPAENLSGRTIALYRLQERVGEGGTAAVYRAEHPEHGVCAVKILKQRLRNDKTAVQRFFREAGYGARISHPSVVRTFEFDEEDGLYYIALEWVEGEPLGTFAQRTGQLAPPLVAHIITALADGLGTAHEAGIIHRDLKPENIVYDPASKTVKLLDFGIARDAQDSSAERLTRTGFFVGTLQYVAPEALSGELVGEAADIFSLAKITYYLLTGTQPHPGRSPREVFQQLLSEEPIPLNDAVKGLRFPPALEAAVMKGLHRQPNKRHASVREFASDLASGVDADDRPQKAGFLNTLKSIVKPKRA